MVTSKSGQILLAIVGLVIGLSVSGCSTSYDPLYPRTYRQVTPTFAAVPKVKCGYRRGCCGGGGYCGAAYQPSPYYSYPRPAAPHYGRARIQPYPYPAYGRPYPGYGGRYPGYGGRYPGYGGRYPGYGGRYPGYGGRYGASVSVAGPYGAESRSAYYGPYGSARSGTSARFY